MYRTKTYLAADWTGDYDAIQQMYKWKTSNYWSLSFIDAHELTQARDGSLNCSIKKSLLQRMNVSKTFVLIVGENTISLRSGSCQYCSSYNARYGICSRLYSVDYKSYIEYECQKAIDAGIKIVVLYNALSVNRNKCPESVRWAGTHVAMKHRVNGYMSWDYYAVKNAMQQ